MLIDFNFDAFSHGQIKSKLWLCEMFRTHIRTSFQKAAFLGSWYGVLPFMMLSNQVLKAQQLVLIDLEEDALKISRKILNFFEVEGMPLKHLTADANRIDYSDETFRGVDLVLNTSCEHMIGVDWFHQIPVGTTVVLQGTNMVHPEHIFPFESLKHFESQFPSLRIDYSGQLNVAYPNMKFERYMILGQKV